MKLAIMQPYFFPYPGYFDLIRQIDRWIVFDTAQYIRHGWVNRNRILHPESGWQYVIVPLKKHQRDTAIEQIEISTGEDWKGKILRQLEHYRKKAPHYPETVSLVESALNSTEQRLSRLNALVLQAICQVLGINFQYDFFSEMSVEAGPIEGPGDWALQIAAGVQATEYIN
ncbi:MAG: WbqC family protein, partial [Fidelibacterota bacterium]